MRLASMVIAALMLAGCAGSTNPSPTDGATELAQALVRPGVPVFDMCPGSCYEASVAADPQGRVFVTEVTGRALRVSQDLANFTAVTMPANPVFTTDGGRGDALLQVAPDGKLWYVALAAEINGGPIRYRGIQVASSTDGGATWATNTLVSRAQQPTGGAQFADRPWLAFAPDGTVHLTWFEAFYVNGFGAVPGLYPGAYDLLATSSRDGGKSFGPIRQIHSVAETRQGATGGAPVVDSTGRLIVPYFAFPVMAGGAAASVRVAISTDGGQSFTTQRVTDRPGSRFAALALGPDDLLVFAWNGPGGALLLSASADHGATWTAATRWNPEGQRVTASPWVGFDHDGNVDVVWYALNNASAQADLHFARGTTPTDGASRPQISLIVANATRGLPTFGANTDFAHAARMPNGDLAVVWSDIQQRQAYVALVTGVSPPTP